MKLADRSPGLVIVLAGIVVYGTILIEIGMWMAASLTLAFAVLAMVVAISVGIVQWFHHLLTGGDDEPYAVEAAPATAPAAAYSPNSARYASGTRSAYPA